MPEAGRERPLRREGVSRRATLILDAEHGHTLVETGVPGTLSDLQAALASVGVGLGEVRRVILTHADLDLVARWRT